VIKYKKNIFVYMFSEEIMEVTSSTKQNTKKRSKAAKIVLWSILGCLCAAVIAIIVWLIIAMCGGTGTGDGGMFGFKFEVLTTATGFIAVVLIMAWLLTEPSFKKEEVIIIDDDRNSYVKKSKYARPVKTAEEKAAEAEAKAKAEAEAAEKAEAPAEEAPSEEKAEETVTE
jgi:cytoskeletal protein RodZ